MPSERLAWSSDQAFGRRGDQERTRAKQEHQVVVNDLAGARQHPVENDRASPCSRGGPRAQADRSQTAAATLAVCSATTAGLGGIDGKSLHEGDGPVELPRLVRQLGVRPVARRRRRDRAQADAPREPLGARGRGRGNAQRVASRASSRSQASRSGRGGGGSSRAPLRDCVGRRDRSGTSVAWGRSSKAASSQARHAAVCSEDGAWRTSASRGESPVGARELRERDLRLFFPGHDGGPPRPGGRCGASLNNRHPVSGQPRPRSPQATKAERNTATKTRTPRRELFISARPRSSPTAHSSYRCASRDSPYTASAMPPTSLCMTCESHFEELVGVSAADPPCHPDCGATKAARQPVFATHGGTVPEQPSFGDRCPAAAVAAELRLPNLTRPSRRKPSSMPPTPRPARAAACKKPHAGRLRHRRPGRRRCSWGEVTTRTSRGYLFVGLRQAPDRLLEGISLTRRDVYIANVPAPAAGNRDPQPDEDEACESHLFKQLELIQPKLVATLGNFATKPRGSRPASRASTAGRRRRSWAADRDAVPDLPSRGCALYARDAKTLEEDFALHPGAPGRRGRPPRRGAAGAGNPPPTLAPLAWSRPALPTSSLAFLARAGLMVELESSSPEETERIGVSGRLELEPRRRRRGLRELGTGKPHLRAAPPGRSAFRLGDEPDIHDRAPLGPGKPDVSHLDLYRFEGVADAEWGSRAVPPEGAVIFVEWPEAGDGVLPPARVRAVAARRGGT